MNSDKNFYNKDFKLVNLFNFGFLKTLLSTNYLSSFDINNFVAKVRQSDILTDIVRYL